MHRWFDQLAEAFAESEPQAEGEPFAESEHFPEAEFAGSKAFAEAAPWCGPSQVWWGAEGRLH